MYIHEAILNTTREMPYITRTAWMVGESGLISIKVQPTDTPDCCVLYSDYSRHGPCRGWQPRAEDLKAGDWIVCPPVIRQEKELRKGFP